MGQRRVRRVLGAAPLVLMKGFPVVSLAEVHRYEGPVRAFPKRFGTDYGKRSIDRLAIAAPRGQGEAQNLKRMQAVLTKCFTFVDDPESRRRGSHPPRSPNRAESKAGRRGGAS